MAGDVNDPYRRLTVVFGETTHLRDAIRRSVPDIEQRIEEGLRNYIEDMEDGTSKAEWRQRARRAEEQFDELSTVTNRLQKRRNAWRREALDQFYDKQEEIRRAEQAEADLAEAREVLRALRPVLRPLARVPREFPRYDEEDAGREAVREYERLAIGSLAQYAKLPWLEEWLND